MFVSIYIYIYIHNKQLRYFVQNVMQFDTIDTYILDKGVFIKKQLIIYDFSEPNMLILQSNLVTISPTKQKLYILWST